jgi:hypothetical protein
VVKKGLSSSPLCRISHGEFPKTDVVVQDAGNSKRLRVLWINRELNGFGDRFLA